MKKTFTLLCLFLLTGCGDDGSPKDYLKIAGGGIIFNYRYSQAGMVVIAQQKYPLPAGSTVAAEFELPGQNKFETVSSPAKDGKLTYKLESNPMTGFKKGGEYKVTIRLLDNAGKELDRDETKFTSDQDQSTLPTKPIVKGLELTPDFKNL
jgi:hypothetical protein